MIEKAEKFYQKEKYKQAEALCLQILEGDQTEYHNDALRIQSMVMLKTNRVTQGLEYLKIALVSNPNSVSNNIAMGHYSIALSQVPVAINSFMKAYQADPKNLEALKCLGDLYNTQNNWPHSITFYAKYIAIDPSNNRVNQVYANSLKQCRFKEYSDLHKTAIETILLDYTINPKGVIHHWLDIISKSPDFKSLAVAISQKDYVLDEIKSYLNAPFLAKGVERLRNQPAPMENFFINIKKDFLARAVKGEDISSFQNILFALSMQSWVNEYAHFVDKEDQENFKKMDIMMNGDDFDWSDVDRAITYLYLYACYKSPVAVSNIVSWGKRLCRAGGDDFKHFYKIQIEDAIEEEKIKKTIPQLTSIDDSISKMVQDMYEESPYPRGVEPVIIDKHTIDETPQDVLFAGCGTGFQILGFSQQYPNGTFTAVDLSSSSLAYAIRQTKQRLNYSSKKIRFGQADILKLDALPDRYDRIYCTGVLHHMHDPEKGLATLKNILRPNGEMRLALYSEMARKEIVSARNHIAKLGYKETFEDIRRFRHDMIEMLDQDDCPDFIKFLVQIIDFYSLSECRDLVFHVQEHRYDIPQILDMLERHDLEFVSFNIRHKNIKETFAKMFPNEGDFLDPMKWHEYEQAHPHTFVEMYDFNVRHK